jgi:hypothetical protein
MSCVNRLTLTALLTLVASATSSLAGQATTTRIEPRPFYGATVTLEEGVRVFRPLPVTRHVVINPGNKASVSVNYNEERTYNYSRSDNYDHSSGGNGGEGRYGGTGYYGGFPIGTPATHNGRGAPGGVFGPIKRNGKGGGKSH